MAKMTSWQAPLTTRRFKTPTGPLADVDSGYVYDFSRQREVVPHPIGSKYKGNRPVNDGAVAAHAIVTTPDTHGTESPFQFPK
jgi:hypothetical protein